MEANQINFVFLTKYCKPDGISAVGYMTYVYKPYKDKNIQAEITVKENTFSVELMEYIGNAIKFQGGAKVEIEKGLYLSREIHKYL